ncbi:uncharacterized protein LOC129187769 [Dunckerocampus dactyliophorus]|uniref:uncharacterized protein LOC129187768 n=1 Tax=Dunckerocampus dactyliophorus TaxID=161453 RepID=UPI0024050DB6|nr:uncharacterized protein LOC129187768 [Dunckerocampus dactyliophorus]XP_054643427.1 uncharacterized protein LOC129187769 [Dunckerocampus dactyliophorus]
MAAVLMEDLRELSTELVRDVLDLAEYVEAGPADPEHVACKAEELIEVVGVISALSDQDVDRRVTANLEEVLRRFSGTRVQQEHTQGPGRLAFDIPRAALEHHVHCGLPACQIAAMLGVSKRTIRRRMQQYGLRKTDLYSAVNDEELDRIVSEVHRRHPNTGYKLHACSKIERMWRDVYEHALDLFYQIFTSLEDQGTLNPDNEVHLFALHWSFLPLIQQSLDSFRDAWNFHGLRPERNQSPQQLWRRYREQGPVEDPTEVYEDYGIDWNGPQSSWRQCQSPRFSWPVSSRWKRWPFCQLQELL